MKKVILTIYIFLSCFLSGQSIDSVLTYSQHFDLALDHFTRGRYKLAENEFKNILIEKRNFNDPVSHFMLAKTQFKQNKEIVCERTCNSYINKYPNSRYEVNVRLLLSDILISKEEYSLALEQLLPIKESIEDSLQNSYLDYRILNVIKTGIGSNKLESLLFYNENIITKSILNLAISYRSLLDGNMNDMELSLSVTDKDILPSYFHNFYESLTRFIGKESTLHGTIAVILPLSGDEEEKGKTYLSGLSKMVNDFQFDLSTNFKIYDNQSSDINTLKILNSINLDKTIIAILGYFSEVSNLASASFSGSIPIMLSKSNYGALTTLSENIYLLSTSSEIQAKLSARYAVNILGYKNIAVLSSAATVNKSYANFFIEELNQLGINPVSTQWFYGSPDNLSKQFSAIRSKAWSLIPQEDSNLQYLDLEIDSLDALFDVDVADFMDPIDDVINNNKMTKRDSLNVVLNTIEVRYKDSMREEHILSYDTTIDVSTLSLLDTEEGDSPMGTIAAIIIIGIIVGILYKKGKLPMMSKKSA